jgi:hypothetical protein
MTRHRLAWILILIVDLAYIAWGAAVAIAPDQVPGPHGKAILPAGYEGYSGGSWSQVVQASPGDAAYMVLVFRLYGMYCVIFGFLGSCITLTAFRRGERWAWWTLLVANTVALLSAMTYDWLVNAIGPFEVTEYLGLALVWGAFAITVPRRRSASGVENETSNGGRSMKYRTLGIITVAAAAALSPTPSAAQARPILHINTRWKECSIQLDPSLTPKAWRQFTEEAGQVVYFRPLTTARPLGRGNFEFSLMQWQTNIDDESAAWNDTFVHPDATHWLYEGSGLKFPGMAFRAGVGSKTDVGLYLTKNPEANYGAWGVQVQQNLIGGEGGWDVSARGNVMALFGPEDVAMNVVGVDVVTSWKSWSAGSASFTPYAGLSTYVASSHEKSSRVNLADERVMSAMGTVGATLQYSFLRLGAEASMARVPSMALKLGVGR